MKRKCQCKSLSLVVFTHNLNYRGAGRLRNCLYSLRNQQDTHLVPDIFVVDQSNDDSFDVVDNYCKEFNAVHVYSHLKKLPFSRTLTFNAGIRMATTDFVGCIDVDNIFAPNFLNVVEQKARKTKLIVCRVWWTPASVDLDSFDMKEFDNVLEKSKLRKSRHAVGACQITTRKWFTGVRGYHEKIVMWGGEDNELVSVAEFTGLRVRWIDRHTSILHQHHERRVYDKNLEKFGMKQTEKNCEIWRKMRATQQVKRNDKNWGNLSISSINDYRS